MTPEQIADAVSSYLCCGTIDGDPPSGTERQALQQLREVWTHLCDAPTGKQKQVLQLVEQTLMATIDLMEDLTQ